MLVAGQRAGAEIRLAGEAPRVAQVEPGGFLARTIALIVDSLILGVLTVGIITLGRLQAPPRPSGSAAGDVTLQANLQQIAIIAGVALINLFYWVGSWHILGASPGMLAVNLRVADMSGRTPGWGRAILRWFVLYVFPGPLLGIVWLISALMIAVGPGKRGLHDLLAGTVVIQHLDPEKVAARERQAQAVAESEAAAAAAASRPEVAPADTAFEHYEPVPPARGGLLPTQPAGAGFSSDPFPAMAPPPPSSPPPPSQPPSGPLPPDYEVGGTPDQAPPAPGQGSESAPG